MGFVARGAGWAGGGWSWGGCDIKLTNLIPTNLPIDDDVGRLILKHPSLA